MVLEEVNMKYLITGSGYLATHLIRELLKSDESCTVSYKSIF